MVTVVVRGGRPSPQTIRKLARFFSGDGASPSEMSAVEDHLLALAGYRTMLPEALNSETLSRLEAKLRGCGERDLTLIESFIDFLNSLGGEDAKERG